uniref:Uncharacterized protein n=1 Tax=Kalanchoe fedtschenkoi TaxID=63787 RepID=A0A7N0V9J7_KALFE
MLQPNLLTCIIVRFFPLRDISVYIAKLLRGIAVDVSNPRTPSHHLSMLGTTGRPSVPHPSANITLIRISSQKEYRLFSLHSKPRTPSFICRALKAPQSFLPN